MNRHLFWQVVATVLLLVAVVLPAFCCTTVARVSACLGLAAAWRTAAVFGAELTAWRVAWERRLDEYAELDERRRRLRLREHRRAQPPAGPNRSHTQPNGASDV